MIVVLPVYNNENEVKQFISTQLFKQTYTAFEIYVVVNGGNFSFEEDERLTILHPAKNTGYLGALRYVVESLKHDFDYITLCNTDLSFDDENFLLNYTKALGNEEFATAAPRVFSMLTKTEQNPLYANRLTKGKLKRLQFFYSNRLLYFIYHNLYYAKRAVGSVPQNLAVEHPYALHGSFITISKKYFGKGGTLNYPVLLYGEELFLAEEAIRINLKNLFITNLCINHYEHTTTGRYNFKQVHSMKASVSFILKNYYN